MNNEKPINSTPESIRKESKLYSISIPIPSSPFWRDEEKSPIVPLEEVMEFQDETSSLHHLDSSSWDSKDKNIQEND